MDKINKMPIAILTMTIPDTLTILPSTAIIMIFQIMIGAIITHTSIKKEKKRGFQSFFVKA